MTCCKQIDLRMCRNDPEPVILPLERLNGCALVQIPDSYCLVLADGEYKVLVRVEKAGGRILKVASASINLPSFGLCLKSASIVYDRSGQVYRSFSIVLRACRLQMTQLKGVLDGTQPNSHLDRVLLGRISPLHLYSQTCLPDWNWREPFDPRKS